MAKRATRRAKLHAIDSARIHNVVFDNTAPALASATVTGSTLVLTYTEAGSGLYGTAPDAADFTVTDGSNVVTVSGVAPDQATREKIVLCCGTCASTTIFFPPTSRSTMRSISRNG